MKWYRAENALEPSGMFQNYLEQLLNEHAPYKRGAVTPKMSFAKILKLTKMAVFHQLTSRTFYTQSSHRYNCKASKKTRIKLDKMAVSSSSSRKRPRFTLQASFSSYEERDTFARRFEAVCELLQHAGAPALDNHSVLCAMLDAVERSARQDNFPGDERVETRSFLRNSGENKCALTAHYYKLSTEHQIGVYVGDEHHEDETLFLTERCCFSDLVEGLSSACPCGLTIKPWAVKSVIQVCFS